MKYVDLNIYEFDPLRTSENGEHQVFISEKIHKKKALVDVESVESDTCFKWAFIAAVKGVKEDCKQSDLNKYVPEFNFSTMDFPVYVYSESGSSKLSLE